MRKDIQIVSLLVSAFSLFIINKSIPVANNHTYYLMPREHNSPPRQDKEIKDTVSSSPNVIDIYYHRVDIKNWGCNDCFLSYTQP